MSRFSAPINPQLKAIRWRLWLSSLGVISCTLVAFGMVVYQVVAQSLEQKSDRQLTILADAATHRLPDILRDPTVVSDRVPEPFDNDGDLDLSWQDLRQAQQSIEWFDSKGKLLARVGNLFPATPLRLPAELDPEADPDTDRDLTEDAEIHSLTVPVVIDADHSIALFDQALIPSPSTLQGYVRVSESNQIIQEELARLRSGLQWGGMLALLLSGIGGWWLTQQSLQPIDRSISQLKQFTADASHELRNPLTAIKASVEVMQSHPERFQAADAAKLEAIASATNQMRQLVDDLLWLARSDRTWFREPVPVLIPLEELVEEVLDQYLPQAEQQQIALTSIPPLLGVVQGDPAQLKRLLGNLVANALQYTAASGTVTLSSDIQDQTVQIQVRDTGIGIAPEHLSQIFDRFWRADQARSRREGGSGLGLAIAQAIVQQHQGQITVHSQLGQGSCFLVELPLAASEVR